jgi:MSHA pilin protein MshD
MRHDVLREHPTLSRQLLGFTLVELVISIVVIAVAVAGTLQALSAAAVSSADPMIRHQGLAIAEAYIEEIALQPFSDPDDASVCPAPEADRDRFDNVCDYQGLDESGAHDREGRPVPGLEAYRVRVSVDTSASLGSISGSADVLRVDVRVSHPVGLDLSLSTYRTRY